MKLKTMKLKNLFLPVLLSLAFAAPSHAIAVLLKKGQAGTGATSTAVSVLLVDSATGQTGQAGLAASSTKTVELPGATSYIAATGTLVDTGGGVYDYFPSASETAATGVLKLRVAGSGIQTSDTSAQVVGFDPTDGSLLGLSGVATILTQTSSAVHQADVTASLTGTPFITLPGAATTSGTGMVLTYKQVQALIDSVSGGDNVTSGPPVASGTATVTYYLRGQTHSSSTITEVATVTYDANKQQVSRTVKVAQPFPAVN